MNELSILYQAFHSDVGIEVELEGNWQVALQRLYRVRRAHPELEVLQINRAPNAQADNVFWILKNPQAASKAKAPAATSKGEPLFSLADIFKEL